MLTRSAQPRTAISSPANGSTGQKPRAAITAATPNDTKHTLPKNSSAARMLSEQCGQISMRCGSGCTDVLSAGVNKWYCRDFFIQVRSLEGTAHARGGQRLEPATARRPPTGKRP